MGKMAAILGHNEQLSSYKKTEIMSANATF
jgi:hypothetical protein